MKKIATCLTALLLTAAPAALAAPPSGQVVRTSPRSAPDARPAAQVSVRPQKVAQPIATKPTLSPSQLERRLEQLERELALVKRSWNQRYKLERQRVLQREIAQVERDLRTATRVAKLNQRALARSRRG